MDRNSCALSSEGVGEVPGGCSVARLCGGETLVVRWKTGLQVDGIDIL